MARLLVLYLVASTICCGATPDGGAAKPSREERLRAECEWVRSKLREGWPNSGGERSFRVLALMEIANATPKSSPDLVDKDLAFRALGAIPQQIAFDFLIENVAYRSGMGPRRIADPLSSYPAAYALRTIGSPARQAVLNRLDLELPETDLRLLAYLLFRMDDDGAVAVFRVKRALAQESEARRSNQGDAPTVRERNLTAAMLLIEDISSVRDGLSPGMRMLPWLYKEWRFPNNGDSKSKEAGEETNVPGASVQPRVKSGN